MLSHLAVILALVPHLRCNCLVAMYQPHTGQCIGIAVLGTDDLETIWSSLYCRLGADVRRGASQFAEKLSLLEVPQPAPPDKVRGTGEEAWGVYL